MKFILFISTFITATLSFAQEVGQPAVDALTKVNDSIPVAIPATVLALLVWAIGEITVRVIPTAKPKSTFLAIGKVFGLLGSIFTKLSTLLDSVGQNLKPDAAAKSEESPSEKKAA